MNALLKKGVDSAYAVVRYDQMSSSRAFKGELGGEAQARLTYAKAQQVHNAVLNIATSYLTRQRRTGDRRPEPGPDREPGAQGPRPASRQRRRCHRLSDPGRPLRRDGLLRLRALPLDPEPGCVSGGPPAVLRPPDQRDEKIRRRCCWSAAPIIQHLPLTCENTNTPLPYIDLVNETLEYYVANSLSLDGYAGHNTDGDAQPEELLASPQFVSDAAYTALAQAELFRPRCRSTSRWRTCAAISTGSRLPLPEVMEALRKDDGLERGERRTSTAGATS